MTVKNEMHGRHHQWLIFRVCAKVEFTSSHAEFDGNYMLGVECSKITNQNIYATHELRNASPPAAKTAI